MDPVENQRSLCELQRASRGPSSVPTQLRFAGYSGCWDLPEPLVAAPGSFLSSGAAMARALRLPVAMATATPAGPPRAPP